MKLKFVASLSAVVLSAIVLAVAPVQAAHKCGPMRGIDTNHDNVLSTWEVSRAASRTFMRLNTDGDGTLELDELRGRMGPRAFAAADRIKGRGIDHVEYQRYVRSLFMRINRDGDRTLECDEVCTRLGSRLLRLLK